MYRRTLILFLGLFLLLSSGESMQMIERANAACRPWPSCCWQGIVYGSATVTNPKARITALKLEDSGKTGESGKFLDVEVSPEMLKAFSEEGLLGKPVYGFIILTKMEMTGFVPTTRTHGDEDKAKSPQKALKEYNEAFEEAIELQSGMQNQKGKR